MHLTSCSICEEIPDMSLQSVSNVFEHGVQMQSDTVHNFDGQTSIFAKAGLSVSSGKGSVFLDDCFSCVCVVLHSFNFFLAVMTCRAWPLAECAGRALAS